MKIGLIDVDGHNFPNLALMKISAWHKKNGDSVEWWWGFSHYDRVYMSKVFDETYTPDIPEPLTVDELLEMAKEPVWTVGVSYTRDGTFSMWDIIESVNENGIHFGYSDEYVEWWNYGLKNMDGNLLGWLAYRRNPQEV